MHTAPTVIVLACPATRQALASSDEHPSPWSFHSLLTNLAAAQDCGLPVALVATASILEAVRAAVQPARLLSVNLDPSSAGVSMADALRTGVQACARSGGWIALPTDHIAPRAATLREMGRLIAQHPVVYANHPSERAMPMGFGPELFSELMRLRSDRELLRLINRYPSRAVEMDAVGALLDREGLATASPSQQGDAPLAL